MPARQVDNHRARRRPRSGPDRLIWTLCPAIGPAVLALADLSCAIGHNPGRRIRAAWRCPGRSGAWLAQAVNNQQKAAPRQRGRSRPHSRSAAAMACCCVICIRPVPGKTGFAARPGCLAGKPARHKAGDSCKVPDYRRPTRVAFARSRNAPQKNGGPKPDCNGPEGACRPGEGASRLQARWQARLRPPRGSQSWNPTHNSKPRATSRNSRAVLAGVGACRQALRGRKPGRRSAARRPVVEATISS